MARLPVACGWLTWHAQKHRGSGRATESELNTTGTKRTLQQAVHLNLTNLSLNVLDLAHLRVGGFESPTPLGGFTPLQSDTLRDVAERLQATPMGVALAWLLQRSPNILLIPGTSSLAHLRDNFSAAALELPADASKELNAIAQ